MATLRIRDDVVYREVDGLVVALSLDSGEYVSLDEIGTEIWRLIERHGDLAAVRAEMLAAYDIDEATCDEELSRFVTMLVDRRLLAPPAGN